MWDTMCIWCDGWGAMQWMRSVGFEVCGAMRGVRCVACDARDSMLGKDLCEVRCVGCDVCDTRCVMPCAGCDAMDAMHGVRCVGCALCDSMRGVDMCVRVCV